MPIIEPIPAQRGDIRSVLVLNATTTARPHYALTAPKSGTVTYAPGLQPGTVVKAGTEVARVGDKAVKAPTDSEIIETPIPDGLPIAKRIPILTLRSGSFAVEGTIPVTEAFRLYDGATEAKVSIEGGPSGIDCLPAAPAHPQTEDQAAEPTNRLQVLCLLDGSKNLIEGLPAKIGLTTGDKKNVLTLPISAVDGVSEREQ